MFSSDSVGQEETKVVTTFECNICKSKENLKLCSKCHSVSYCSVEHQKEDWQKHKKNCKEMFKIYQKPGK